MPKNAVCFVCGAIKDEIRFRRYNEYALCEKHFQQMVKYQKITDETKRVHKKDPKDLKSEIVSMLDNILDEELVLAYKYIRTFLLK